MRIAQRELPKTFLNGVSTYYEIDPPEFSDHYDPNDVSAPWGARFAEAKGKVLVTDAHIIEGGWTRPSKLKVLYELPAPYWQRLKLLDFFADRLKVQQREAGVRHDLIDAVFAVGGEDDLVRLLARVKALQAFVTTDEGANLLAGYKRAANILKSSPLGEGDQPEAGGEARAESPHGEGHATPLVPLHPQPSADGPPPRAGEELTLLTALNTAEPLAASAIEAEQFEDAMAALASLRRPIDAFFDGVMVNDPDPTKRAYRLGLLARFRDAVHRVADFSRIEG
jgi:glycyl-tRNA synthetase beta chain